MPLVITFNMHLTAVKLINPSLEIIFILNCDNNLLEQGFPNWGTCTPRGTFRLLKEYIIM